MAYRKVDEASLTSVADAIRAKGGTSGALTFPEGFVKAVSAIQAGSSGGGENEIPETRYVYFYDYDGAYLEGVRVRDLTEETLPTPPEHEGLEFMGWAWSLETMRSIVGSVSMLPKYRPTDGCTHIFVEVAENAPLTLCLATKDHPIEIAWGDGSTDTLLGIESLGDDYTYFMRGTAEHTYSSAGPYEIVLSCEGDYAIGHDASSTTCLVSEKCTTSDRFDTVKEVWACDCRITAGGLSKMSTLTKYASYNVKYNIYDKPDSAEYEEGKNKVDNRIFYGSPVATAYVSGDSLGVEIFYNDGRGTIKLSDYGTPLPYESSTARAMYYTGSNTLSSLYNLRGLCGPGVFTISNCPLLHLESSQKVKTISGTCSIRQVYAADRSTINGLDFSCSGISDLFVPWAEGEFEGAPWGATYADIHYNYTEE